MSSDLSPQDIKETRGKYGLSRKAFAQLLGIGEASMARYEAGAKPTKANANLIRAAAHPRFMLECMNNDGDQLTKRQRDKTEKILYSMVYFDEEGEVMDINDMYMLTLEQEILNEHAASIMADIDRYRRAALKEGDETMAMVFEDLGSYLAQLKPQIIWEENDNKTKLAELRGKIEAVAKVASRCYVRAA